MSNERHIGKAQELEAAYGLNESTSEFVDPTKLEKDLINKHHEELAKQSPADKAALFHQKFFPQFMGLVAGLPKREMEKVLLNLAHAPIPLEDHLPKTSQGKQALGIAVRLQEAMQVMTMTIAMENTKFNVDNSEEVSDNSTEVNSNG